MCLGASEGARLPPWRGDTRKRPRHAHFTVPRLSSMLAVNFGMGHRQGSAVNLPLGALRSPDVGQG